MVSSQVQGKANLTFTALFVVLVPVFAACGGGETGATADTTRLQAGTGPEGRARALALDASAPGSALSAGPSDVVPAQDMTEDRKFGAPDGMIGDLFGWSVAAAGSQVVVGMPQNSPIPRITTNLGAAFVFDSAGTFVRELVPASASERSRDDAYGISVSTNGQVIAVGSPGADDVGSFAGEVFLFNAETGAQLANLVPTGTRRNPPDGSAFGSAVDVSADRIVVGAPGTFASGAGRLGGHGAIYLYDATTRRLITRVTPPGAKPKDNVGHSVSVEGGTVVAGAPFDSVAALEAGAVYVFDSATGSLRFKLTAADASAQDRFGFSVSTHGGLIAVGVPFDDDRGDASGSVHLFNATTGAFLRKIVASDAGINDQFGIAVDLVGNTLVVGAWGDNDGAGSVYIFDASTGVQLGKRVASDAAPPDILGRSVALSGSAVIAGAARDADRGEDSGSVYLFGLAGR